MDGKQRMLTALDRGQPDMVPVWELAFNESSIIGIAKDFLEPDKLPPNISVDEMTGEQRFQLVNALFSLVRGLDLDGISARTLSPMEKVDKDHVRDCFGGVYRTSEHGLGY
ncbi:MAG: hypothetical protein OEL75_04110, partial [Kiritimatiellaceae bacterium]|nr:hypothetical protein [Kiritimatiellaceae bacterium]